MGPVVYYRYGAFSSEEIFTPEGSLLHVIRDPQGQAVPDTRGAWFASPPWAEDPFVKSGKLAPIADLGTVKSVLLNDRYRVAGALRHANKGGVYRALDERTGDTVVLKEARAHVDIDRNDDDARDRLRSEEANLRRLEGAGVAPRVRDLFAKEDHLFVVIDQVPGTTLRRHALDRRSAWRRPLPAAEVDALICKCAALVECCHQTGLLIVDFTPNNLMLLPGGELRLIDLEMACPPGQSRPAAGGTPAYSSPEQLRGELPQPADDYFALGAVAFFIATLYDPFLLPDRPAQRSDVSRIAAWLDRLVQEGIVEGHIPEVVLGCLAASPAERWSPAQVIRHCVHGHRPAGPVAAPPPTLGQATFLELARGIALDALDKIDARDLKHPIEPSCQGSRTDPCNVQHGAAGTGRFLVSLLSSLDERTAVVKIRDLAGWILSTIKRQPARPAGLYFGSAGAAWFVLDAACALADPGLLEESSRLANSLPLEPEVCDVTHGAAGIGIMLLHFYSTTGREAFLRRAVQAADTIVAAATAHPGGLTWQRSGQNPERGKEVFYGFAHGNAGIAYFLLAAAAATGDARYLAAAEGAVGVLVQAVEMDEDRAFWPHGPGRPSRWPYWCNGSSGVGTTLLRAHVLTGERRYRELAEAAARAVTADRWHGSLGQCHGLAGNGEFLLDLSYFLREERYREEALHLADIIFLHRVYRDGRALFPDDSGFALAPDFATGTSGIGAFFHRLARGGARPFMVDEVLVTASSTGARTAAAAAGSAP
jgi:serine/threonine protein kinase